MAVVNIQQSFNFAAIGDLEGEITSTSATQIVVLDGTEEIVFTGQFAYNGANISGTVDSLRYSVGGQTVLGADSLNYSAAKLQDYIEAGQFQTAVTDILSGADSIRGSSGADTILAGQGNDTVEAGSGNDVVFGGQGDGADILRLGQGADQAYGGDGADSLDGGADNDILGGGFGADTIDGGAGDDAIYGGADASADRVRAGQGNDVIYVGAGNDTVTGNEGNDTIGAGAGADVIRGGSGDDVVYLGLNDGAADVFETGSNDTQGVQLGNGNDTVYAFANGQDHIDVRGSGITQFSQLSVTAAADGDAVITLASGQTVTLDGVSLAQVDASDFIF